MSENLKPFVEQLKSRVSIVDIIGRSVPLKPKGQNWWGCCPFHNEKTPSFSVSEERGIFKCFGCGEGGDVITFLMKKFGMGYIDAIKELAGIAGMKMPDFRPRDPEEESRENKYFDTMAAAMNIYIAALPGSPAAEYLARRKLPAAVVEKYGLGYAPKNSPVAARFGPDGLAAGLTRHSTHGGADYDFFRNRLMFPIIDIRGRVVAFSGRSLDGSEPKYMNIAETEFFAKRRTLFGINFALPEIRLKKRAIVVEGQIDCMQMQTHGYGETIAPLGTALTAEHIEILLKYAKELVFCFDGDTAGQKAAARAAGLVMPLLKAEHTIRFAFVDGGKDPDEILTAGGSMDPIINAAAALPDFVWTLANNNYPVMTESGRVNADRWLRAEYEKIPDLMLKNEYLLVLKNKEWEQWNKYRREIKPEMRAPDPTDRAAHLVNEIARKFPELYGDNFELLGAADPSDPYESRMTEETAKKVIREIALKKQLDAMISESAPAAQIQSVRDQILEIWA
ncbi:MAG: DNA primase [Rickettsiales bacterium]|jgi:DNA primase|nr:DNA primase [Rickettsiales bacterium]